MTVSKEKYKLKFLDAIQLFDGKALYTIVPENEEITITQAEEEEDFGLNPKELLQFYKEGYESLMAYCDDWNEKMWYRATKTKGFQPISVHMFNDMIGAAKKKTYF